MGKGLFCRLQSYFSSSFGGRYVEYLIKEAIEEQPKLAALLFGVNRFDTLEVEYRFRIGGRTRIADLAFLDAETERPTCLVEIKYDDHKNPGNAEQLEYYLRFCDKENCEFVFLSQHLPTGDLQKKLQNREALVLFSDLAEKLKSSEESVGGLLRRFFVDRGLVMHKFESRDLANLKSFLFRLLNPWGGQGRSQNKDAISGGAAEAFGNLLRNMNIIAKEVAANVPGRSPTIDFDLDPWVEPKKLRKDAEEDPKAKSISAWYAKAGGTLTVYGRTRLDDTATNWLQIEFGIGLEANSGDKNFHPFSYAAVHSYSFKEESSYKEQYASFRILHDKQRAVTALRERIYEVIEVAIKRNLSKSQVAKLKKYQRDLRQS